MNINTNILSLSAQRNLGHTTKAIARAMQRLASGQRVNSARDDAAGLAIANGLEAQRRGMLQAVRNMNDAWGFLNTADGAISTQTSIVQRMRDLAVQAANGTFSDTDRSYLNNEFSALLAEFNRIATQTSFNGTNLLDGSLTTMNLQVGTRKGETISFSMSSTRSSDIFDLNTSAIPGFQTRTITTGGSSLWALTSADLDEDGNQDVITADSSDNTVSVLLGNGNGTFKARTTYSVGSNPKYVIAKDVNGDGSLDLVSASDGVVSVLIGNGNGTFKARTTYSVGSNPYGVEAQDLNGDGKLDLITTDGVDNALSVLIGNGNGTFKARVTYSTGTWPLVFKVADINGDAKQDLIAGDWGSATVSVLLGNGNGTFSSRVTHPLNSRPQGLAVGDFSGDGKIDLAIQGSDNTISILLGNADGTFKSPATYQTGMNNTTDNLMTCDINGDGKLDLVSGDSEGNTLSVFVGNGDGTFQSRVTYQTGNRPVASTAADFNGDDAIDLMSLNHNDNTISLFMANSLTAFTLPFDISSQSNAQNILEVLDGGLAQLSAERSNVGALQSRLDFAESVAENSIENISFARSQIMDADYASETAEFTRLKILQQAGIAVLGQANLNSRLALKLLENMR